jgi:hypothetical protein
VRRCASSSQVEDGGGGSEFGFFGLETLPAGSYEVVTHKNGSMEIRGASNKRKKQDAAHAGPSQGACRGGLCRPPP